MTKFVDKKKLRKLQELEKRFPYSLDEIIDFYRAAYKTYREIITRKPTLIIAPLRGAEPLIKSIKLFATLERKNNMIPPIFYPRAGEQTKEKTTIVEKFTPDYAKAMSNDEKLREFSRIIDQAIKRTNRKKTITEVLVIDEAFNGGSIVKTIKFLKAISEKKGKNVKINAIAIAQKGTEKNEEYLHLKANKIITEHAVKRLFTMDSQHFLRPLIAQTNFFGLPKRPKLGVSKTALYGNLDLMEALTALHEGKNPKASFVLARLPKKIQRKI